MNYKDRLKSAGRNDDCPCGSGKKYKKCHLAKDEAQELKAMKKLEKERAEAAAAEAKKEEKSEAADNTPQVDHNVKHVDNVSIPKTRKRDQFANIPRRSAI